MGVTVLGGSRRVEVCKPEPGVLCKPDSRLDIPPGYRGTPEPVRPPAKSGNRGVPSGPTPPLTAGARPVDLSPARVETAVAIAAQRLGTYLTTRTASLDSPMMWLPYDGTRRFRIGTEGSDGFGFDAAELSRVTTDLVARGFPRFVEAESRLINATNLAARLTAGKTVGLQHFPGGTPDLETTEQVPMHYGDAAQVRGFIQPYIDILRQSPPPSIMLSHATYTRDGFPGIEALEASRDPRPGFLSGVPFDQIPASLNPTLVRYVRETLGYRGVVTPDWYDMGAIRTFIRERTNIDLGQNPDALYQDRARAFILAVEAGVDFPTSIDPGMASDRALWTAFERNHPREYAAFVERLDQCVRETYDRVRPSGAPPMDTSLFSFEDKVLSLIYNPRTQTNGESYRDYFAGLRNDQGRRGELARVMLDNGTGDWDVWNRTGVMTLMFRQFMVEQLSGSRFPSLPSNVRGMDAATRDRLEENWFNTLMSDANFTRVYRAVDWSSPEMAAFYQRYYERTISGMTPRDPTPRVPGRT